MRVRTLKSMNNLDLLLTIHLGDVGKLVLVWLSQMAGGMKKILSYAHNGVKTFQDIRENSKYQQLELKL